MKKISVGNDSFVDLDEGRVGTAKVKSVEKWKGGNPDGECFLRVYYDIKPTNRGKTEGQRLALVSDGKVIAIAISGPGNFRRILSDSTWMYHSSVVQERDPDGFRPESYQGNVPDSKYALYLVHLND